MAVQGLHQTLLALALYMAVVVVGVF